MFRLVKSIVDENRRLIGFIIEGRDKDLDGFLDTKVQKPIQLKVLYNMGFANNQIDTRSGGIREKGNFRVNNLPMLMFDGKELVSIDNGVRLIKKFVQDGEIVGFRVEFEYGSVDNFIYRNVVQLSGWFKPENFVVRRPTNRKAFISGKPGVMRLEELPDEIIGQKKGQEKVKQKSKQAVSKVEIKATEVDNTLSTGKLDNDMDILDIYDIVEELDGLIINLPGEEYKAASGSGDKVDPDFVPLGVGEYAYPSLGFNKTGLNANAKFRKPGMVLVDFGDGVQSPVQAFTYSTKSIFLNGKNYMKRFGVAVPKLFEDTFIHTVGKNIGVKPIDNNQMIQAVSSLSGKMGMVFYEVDTSKIDLMTKEKIDRFYLSPLEIKELVHNKFTPRLISKHLSKTHGIVADLTKIVSVDPRELEGRQLIGIYAAMNEEYLDRITEAGIDKYSGSYYKRSVGKRKADKSVISIDYEIDGEDVSKLTCKKIAELGAKGVGLPQKVIDVIQELDRISVPEDRLRRAYEITEEVTTEIGKIRKKLWLHKCAMYIKGNECKIHTKDSDLWVHDDTRRTKAKIYNCIAPGCEGLMVAVLNIDL